MKKIEAFVDESYRRRHQNQLDSVLPIVADEGLGKSTLMLQMGAQYIYARDGEYPTVDDLLSRICYDRGGFQEMMAESDQQALIMVPDAARILYSMDFAKSEQKKIEKDLMDVRGLEYMILLGFQSWDRIGGEIKERRAKMAFKIPRRGLVRGYNRDAMDHKEDTGDWPQSTLTDKFPPLDGTELWDAYQDLDREKKRERLAGEGSTDVKDVKRDKDRAYALRLVMPWDDNRGMSYREAAHHHAKSKAWIGETVRDWKDGEYRDLVDADPASGEKDRAPAAE